MTPEEQKEKMRDLVQAEVTAMMLVINLTVGIIALTAYIIQMATNLSYFQSGIHALIVIGIILFCFRNKINHDFPLYIANKFPLKRHPIIRLLMLWSIIIAPLLIINLWEYIRTFRLSFNSLF